MQLVKNKAGEDNQKFWVKSEKGELVCCDRKTDILYNGEYKIVSIKTLNPKTLEVIERQAIVDSKYQTVIPFAINTDIRYVALSDTSKSKNHFLKYTPSLRKNKMPQISYFHLENGRIVGNRFSFRGSIVKQDGNLLYIENEEKEIALFNLDNGRQITPWCYEIDDFFPNPKKKGERLTTIGINISYHNPEIIDVKLKYLISMIINHEGNIMGPCIDEEGNYFNFTNEQFHDYCRQIRQSLVLKAQRMYQNKQNLLDEYRRKIKI